ncbi:replication-relaxation family protein [Bacillus luti]|uniref:replication-relaxation family protein n=1 Tax=Bacillus luti TaxID=2026191 RepID=UPI0012E70FAE|nr:replication-relaxation family protein [Bacillus luti]
MKKRDLQIIEFLEKARCSSRDQLVELFFSDLKNPISNCNTILKRLRDRGYIDVSTDFQPFVYFPKPSGIKKDSMKIPHFLKIVDMYLALREYEEPKVFTIEPKYGKDYSEPDIFTIWKGIPLFIEVQRTHYSSKVMASKTSLYEKLYDSQILLQEPWQNPEQLIHPYILLISDYRYNIESKLPIMQYQSINQFIEQMAAKYNLKKQISNRTENKVKTKIER